MPTYDGDTGYDFSADWDFAKQLETVTRAAEEAAVEQNPLAEAAALQQPAPELHPVMRPPRTYMHTDRDGTQVQVLDISECLARTSLSLLVVGGRLLCCRAGRSRR